MKILFALCVSFAAFAVPAAAETLDLTDAIVVAPSGVDSPGAEALDMLLDEAEKRTRIRWETQTEWPEGDGPVIVLGRADRLEAFSQHIGELPGGNLPAEGYRIRVDAEAERPLVVAAGNDSRGTLFAAGRLLREMRLTRDAAGIADGLRIETAPNYPMRGHQLGYRPKPNTYDGWTPAMFEQYIRDLAAFGTNAIELIPPRSDDREDSPHFPLPKIEMIERVSGICDRHGLDFWLWYPAMDEDYSDPDTVEFALGEWGDVFRRLPRLDAVFVPCGDPGDTPPELLMPMLARQAEQLETIHPGAEWWVGPQGFDTDRLETLRTIIDDKTPWLTGLVYGPWTRLTMAEFRGWVPERYPIRHYPDITHSVYSQFPVPMWDPAYYLTEGREAVNPRPMEFAHIFRALQPFTDGFIAYSEGCNDDVNKILWSALGWDPEADVDAVLRSYARYFIGPEFEDAFAQGLLALERNWQGPLMANPGVEVALKQFEAMEREASPGVKSNWRFQQGVFRANYDAFVRRRLVQETALEAEAMAVLARAGDIGPDLAMREAEAILNRAVSKPAAPGLRARLFELGEALFQSIRMQMHTERYAAGRPDGAVLDRADAPLNNRPWLVEEFGRIRGMEDGERLAAIGRIVHWTDPGPGGFYDNLGEWTAQPRLVGGAGFENDPELYRTPRSIPERAALGNPDLALPLSWKTHMVALYDLPLEMRYADLDPAGAYRVRVVYAGGPLRLTADGSVEIHPMLRRVHEPLEFDIPPRVTGDGNLRLTWERPKGGGSTGRGNEVCEVWLMKKPVEDE